MSYPSIISQPGSASRNVKPIIDALQPLLSVIPSIQRSNNERHVLELASFPYEHITAFAKQWPGWEWWGTARDDGEVNEINGELAPKWNDLSNLHPSRQLDIGNEDDWTALRALTIQRPGDTDGNEPRIFSGVIMLNLIHCCPPELPEHVFRQLSPLTDEGRALLDLENGWIVAYGAYRNDDGSYKTKEDEQFDSSYIKAKHESFGLRTIKSITELAQRWGFTEESRKELPKGNMFVVWCVKYPA